MLTDKLDQLIRLFVWYSNRISATVAYSSWDDAFCRQEVNSVTFDLLSELRKHIDFNNLTVREAQLIGFKRWNSSTNLYLIPLYLLPILPVGIELTCIDGETITYDGSNIDNTTRLGCLAYGVKLES